ncbi:MAG: hypothetical protein NT069_21815, partial [Planctomycetota bacterium]|nr:hypothetical protein [Planctomycetota bacterium]
LATRLKNARVPFQRELELNALDRLTTGLLILAENNKVTDDTLAKIAWNLVQRGVSVLWIAPTALELPDPTSDNVATPPREFHLRREEFVAELDKRFSAAPWNDPTTIRRWSPASVRSRVVWRKSSSPVGWSWIEGIWPNRARLMVCGLPLVSLWDLDPTPRYLLLKLLERVQADDRVDAPIDTQRDHQ